MASSPPKGALTALQQDLLREFAASLKQALADAQQKDAAADPATLAWVLDQVTLGPDAALPGGTDPVELNRFRNDLIQTSETRVREGKPLTRGSTA